MYNQDYDGQNLNDAPDPRIAPAPTGPTATQQGLTPVPGHPGLYYNTAGVVFDDSGKQVDGYVNPSTGAFQTGTPVTNPNTGIIEPPGTTHGDPVVDPPTLNPGPGPAPAPTGGGPGTGITAPFTGTFEPPPAAPIGTFTPPQFQGPSPGDAFNDPGYQFGLGQGLSGLQNWAAARGTLNDTGTAKALTDYALGAAGQQYKSVWDRNFSQWKTGVLDPAEMNYQTQAQNTGHLNDVANTNSWNAYLQKWNIFRDQRDSTNDKTFQWATA